MTLKNKQQGFTIVELLIVIVVIGILAALVITTFTGIQQKARDTERQTDIKALQGQIEAYYAQKGNYPIRGAVATGDGVNNATWRGLNMKGLDAEALKDPKNPDPAGTATAILGTTATAATYKYDVLNAAGTSCEGDELTCVKYTLEADMETSGAVNFVKTALN